MLIFDVGQLIASATAISKTLRKVRGLLCAT